MGITSENPFLGKERARKKKTTKHGVEWSKISTQADGPRGPIIGKVVLFNIMSILISCYGGPGANSV